MTDVLHDVVLPKLEGVRRSGGNYSARCPVHDDRQPSLSISVGRRHPVVFTCQAGCDRDAILDALGLRWTDLCKPREELRKGPVPVTRYDYLDEHGTVLFAKERLMPKSFRIKRPDGRGGWTWGLGDTQRVLYRLPQVLAAVQEGRAVYVVEGEKDVHAVENAGAVATCNFDGAAKSGDRPKWRSEYGDALKSAHVVIVADNDDAGRAHAWAVHADLRGKAASVRVTRGRCEENHSDLSDHLAAGYGLDGLVPLDDRTAEADKPTTEGEDPDGEFADAITERLGQLRNLLLDSAGLDEVPPPQPLLDGILFHDSLAWLHGKPGHGKSFVAIDWAGCIANKLPWQQCEVLHHGRVVYLIAEGVSGLRQRVRAWESMTGFAMDGVTFLPVAVQMLNYVDREAFARLLAELAPVLVVIDTQARVTVGAEENSAKDMGQFVDAADQIRQATRACILIVHHEARAGENMRGSTSLEGAATTIVRVVKDGPRIRLDNPKQKDAPPFDPIRLSLASHGESAVLMSQDSVGLARELSATEDKIMSVMRDSFGTTGASGMILRDATSVPKTSFYRSLNLLLSTGLLKNTGTGKRPFYVLAEDG